MIDCARDIPQIKDHTLKRNKATRGKFFKETKDRQISQNCLSISKLSKKLSIYIYCGQMSVSPTPSAPPSAPRTPARAGALGSVNPNDMFTRGRTVDKSRHIDKENEWQSATHARRCLSCNSLGPCPCRGVSLPPEEKKRRIEAVLANTDFAKSRQRREFIKLSDLEARERMGIERREGDAFAFIVSLDAIQRREAAQRYDVMVLSETSFDEIVRKREALWAMIAAHQQQIYSFVNEEEPSVRHRISEMEGREFEHRLANFQEMAQCLLECLAEQAAQREDFCNQVNEMLVDFFDEEDVAFMHITTMDWQMGLETVAQITEAKRAARFALESSALEALIALVNTREEEVTHLFNLFVEEHGSRLEWMRGKMRAREALADEAVHTMTVLLPRDRETALTAMYAHFTEEHALRVQWVDSRAEERDWALRTAVEGLQQIVSEWSESHASLARKEAEEREARQTWEEEKATVRAAFARSAYDALLAIQSQRADEVHAFHEQYLSEHTARLEWMEEKLRVRQAFAADSERVLWSIFTAARDASISMASEAEEGVAEVLAVIRAKAEERRVFVAEFVAEFEASFVTNITTSEATTREQLKSLFEDEGRRRSEWAAERTVERRSFENEVTATIANLFDHEFMPSLGSIISLAEEEKRVLRERWEKLLERMSMLGNEETAARATLLEEEATVVFGSLQPTLVTSWESSKRRETERRMAEVESAEVTGRSQIVAAVEEEYAGAEQYHSHMLSSLSEAAMQRLQEQREELLENEGCSRSLMINEAVEAMRGLYLQVRTSLQVAWEAERAADAARLYADQQRHMQLCMLRESLSAYGSAYTSSDGSDVTAGLPTPVADALRSATTEQIEQMSAMVFGFGDHVGAFSNNIDAALRRGAQLHAEEERAMRAAETLCEQRDFYANKHFTDNATQQAKLLSIRQNVVNRRQESKRLDGTLKETTAALQTHKGKVEAMKEAYRGKR